MGIHARSSPKRRSTPSVPLLFVAMGHRDVMTNLCDNEAFNNELFQICISYRGISSFWRLCFYDYFSPHPDEIGPVAAKKAPASLALKRPTSSALGNTCISCSCSLGMRTFVGWGAGEGRCVERIEYRHRLRALIAGSKTPFYIKESQNCHNWTKKLNNIIFSWQGEPSWKVECEWEWLWIWRGTGAWWSIPLASKGTKIV